MAPPPSPVRGRSGRAGEPGTLFAHVAGPHCGDNAAVLAANAWPVPGATATQPRPGAARAAFLGGSLLVWTAFAVIALGGDAVLYAATQQWHWLMHHPEVVAVGVLVLAGAFRFSALKDRCMDKCRHPLHLSLEYHPLGRIWAGHLGCASR